MYLLDTNMVRLAFSGHPNVTRQITAIPPGLVLISGVVVEELLNGWFIELDKARGGKPGMGFEAAYLGLFETIRDLVNFPLLAYTPEAEARYRLLKPRSQRVEKRDVRIAAHALEVGMIVVTRNTDDFHRIPEVRYTDWSAGEPAVLQGVGRR